MTWRIAVRLAWSRDPQQRWRQVALVLVTATATLLVLVAFGVARAAETAHQHIVGRSPVWATSPEDARLNISSRGATLADGYQFSVVWLEPRPGHESDPDIVPPGLRRLPEPGQAVVSPGLLARGMDARDLGLSPSDAGSGPAGAIGEEGLASGSEAWAYVRPPAGRTLGSGGALLPLRGYRGPGERVDLEAVPDIPGPAKATGAAAWLLGVPALVLLLGGSRALSSVRLRRRDLLLRLGVSRRRVRFLLAAETLLLAAVGSLLAGLVWLTLLAPARSLPLTGARLLSGGLRIPAATVVAVLVAVPLIAAAGGMRPPAPAPASVQSPPRTWRLLPLAAAMASMLASRWAMPSSSQQALLVFGGMLLLFAALPVGLPVVVHRLGSALAELPRPSAWLAGRRLEASPATLTRPASAVAALVFLAGGAFAIYGRMIEPGDPDLASAPIARFVVDWRDPRPADAATVPALLPGLQVVPTATVDPAEDPTQIGAGVAAFTSCRDVGPWAPRLGVPVCASPDGPDFGADFTRRFQDATGFTPALTLPPVTTPRLLVLGDDPDVPQVEIMKALAGRLPAVNITALGATSPVPRTVGWLVSGWVVASLALCLALLQAVGDRSLAALQADLRLRRLGLRDDELATVQRWSLLTPLALAVPLGYVAAVLFALMGYGAGLTARRFADIGLVAGAVSVMTVALMTVAFRVNGRILREAGGGSPVAGEDRWAQRGGSQ